MIAYTKCVALHTDIGLEQIQSSMYVFVFCNYRSDGINGIQPVQIASHPSNPLVQPFYVPSNDTCPLSMPSLSFSPQQFQCRDDKVNIAPSMLYSHPYIYSHPSSFHPSSMPYSSNLYPSGNHDFMMNRISPTECVHHMMNISQEATSVEGLLEYGHLISVHMGNSSTTKMYGLPDFLLTELMNMYGQYPCTSFRVLFQNGEYHVYASPWYRNDINENDRRIGGFNEVREIL